MYHASKDPATVDYIRDNFGLKSSPAMAKELCVSPHTVNKIVLQLKLRERRDVNPNIRKVVPETEFFNIHSRECWFVG